MGWRWMRLTGRWSTSRGRCEAACSPTHSGLQPLSPAPGRDTRSQNGSSGKVQGTGSRTDVRPQERGLSPVLFTRISPLLPGLSFGGSLI